MHATTAANGHMLLDKQAMVSDSTCHKAGYLTKQGGARGGFKNWKKRWIVLRDDYLCYYKEKPADDPDNQNSSAAHRGGDTGDTNADTPLLGVMPLRGAKIISVKWTSSDGTAINNSENGREAGWNGNDPLACNECGKVRFVWSADGMMLSVERHCALD